MDPAQLSAGLVVVPAIRSASLDSAWDGETAMDRLIRVAHTLAASLRTCGRRLPTVRHLQDDRFRLRNSTPLDEAMRQISQPIRLSTTSSGVAQTIPGRGIGLAAKLRAYNLQDMGHDTLSANLVLGHSADEQSYGVTAAILLELGVTTLPRNSGQVAGIHILDRVEMTPRSWQCGHDHSAVHDIREAAATMMDAPAWHVAQISTNIPRPGLRRWVICSPCVQAIRF
ncbi:GTP cyclohydrolase II-domain-containing protein [Xylaria castorea]|nr:GTP cyclohydrolase II-domain-containing protein [Xylaria castorea]